MCLHLQYDDRAIKIRSCNDSGFPMILQEELAICAELRKHIEDLKRILHEREATMADRIRRGEAMEHGVDMRTLACDHDGVHGKET